MRQDDTPGPPGERLAGRLTAAACGGFLLFTPPLLSAFNHGALLLGLPAVWLYLLAAWATTIGVVAAILRHAE